MTAVAAQRRILPQRSAATTFDLRFGGVDFTATVGRFEDAALTEVFIDGLKAGSAIEAIARDAAILISLASQYGCPLSTLTKAITRNNDGTPQTIIGAVLDAANVGGRS
jgi:hypothetical protein